MTDVKICKKCKEEYPATIEFFHRNNASKDGLAYRCKKCRKEYNISHYNRNRQKIQKVHRKYQKKNNDRIYKQRKESGKDWEYKLKHLYGLSLEEYNNMLNKQKNKCLICGINKKLDIDHNHKNGKVRGLLCQKCNKGIGLLKENELILFNSIKYLRGELS